MQPRAYSYVRFSTPEQSKGDSQRRQSSMAEQYAEAHRLELDKSLTFRDLGVSAYRGTNAEAGRLGDFLRAVADGVVPPGSWLLVENLDRISRQTARHALRALEGILERGITVVTLDDGRVLTAESLDDPMGLLIVILTFMRGNQESATKARRVAAAWESKRAKAGDKPLTQVAPAWLCLDKATGQWTVDPERAEVVRRIFTETLAGTGLERIAATFNRQGVSTFGTAAHWHKSYVSKIIDNPAVIGTMVPHRLDFTSGKRQRKPLDPVPGYFPAVVDQETWEAVRLQRAGGRQPKGAAPVNNLLAALARCPDCGGTMTRVQKGPSAKAGKPYLVCARAKAGAGCGYHAAPLQAVERAIVDYFDILAATPPMTDSRAGDRLVELRAERVELDRAISNLTEAVAQSPLPSLVSKLAGLEAERDKLEAEMARVVPAATNADPAIRSRRVGELQAALQAEPLDKPAANALLRQVFEWVEVDPHRGMLVFKWKGAERRSTLRYPQKGVRKAWPEGLEAA